jgi:outer membrane protein OmpA-like peptidoglycan-associated protein
MLRVFAAGAMLSLVAACTQPMMQADTSSPTSNPPPVPPGVGAIWYHVPFATDSYAITPAGQTTVNAVALFLQQNPNAVATIVGKTDTVGSAQYNMHLSHLRADTVRDALVYGGRVDAARVETRWTGETRSPVKTGDNVPDPDNRVVNIAVH